MKSLVFGFLLIFGIVVAALWGSYALYFQIHSIVIVVGGTIALTFFVTPDSVLHHMRQAFMELFHREESFSDYQTDLLSLAKTVGRGKAIAPVLSKNPLLNYAVEMWEQGVDPDLFVVLLSQKLAELQNGHLEVIQALKSLAKYPPALGMTGTVMGMISLFSKLEGEKSNIGSDIALAMTATFFGLLISNVFIGPITDRLHVKHVRSKRLYENLYQVLLLINRGEPTALIQGETEVRLAA